jgi:NTE family protein
MLSAHEILLIAHLNPLERRGPARFSAEILNRTNQGFFNSPLMRESRALSFVSRLIDNSNMPEGTLRKIQFPQ